MENPTPESTCGSQWKRVGGSPFVGQHDQILRDSGRPADPLPDILCRAALPDILSGTAFGADLPHSEASAAC